MCSKERLLEERVEGAETLAYLIEPDVELQRIASITDHLIAMLADYFKYPSSVSAITDIKRVCSLFLQRAALDRDFYKFYLLFNTLNHLKIQFKALVHKGIFYR